MTTAPEVVSGAVVEGSLVRCECGWLMPQATRVRAFTPVEVQFECPECGEGYEMYPTASKDVIDSLALMP